MIWIHAAVHAESCTTASYDWKIVYTDIVRLVLVHGQVEVDIQTTAHSLIEEVATLMMMIVIVCIIFCFFNTWNPSSLVINDYRNVVCDEGRRILSIISPEREMLMVMMLLWG